MKDQKVTQVEIIARFLCRFAGEDADSPMHPAIGFQQPNPAGRTAEDDLPRWSGFTQQAEELWSLLQKAD